MKANYTIFIDVPIVDVFDFFDDPRNAIEFQDHAKSHLQGSDVIETRPDGRRTIDLRMRAGPTAWVQTIEQVIREPPSRLKSLSWTWTKHRNERISTIVTDRRFVAAGAGTTLTLEVEFQIDRSWRSWRRPFAIVANRLWGNRAAELEQQHALHFIAEHLESRHRVEANPLTLDDAD